MPPTDHARFADADGATSITATPVEVVVVLIGDRRVAFRLADVDEVQRVVRIMPLPGGEELVEGVVDRRGEVVPVFDGRRRFGTTPRPVRLSDQLVFLRTPTRTVALRVDAAVDVAEVELADIAASIEELGGAGLGRCDDGLIVVHDVERFLSTQETAQLEAALQALDQASP